VGVDPRDTGQELAVAEDHGRPLLGEAAASAELCPSDPDGSAAPARLIASDRQGHQVWTVTVCSVVLTYLASSTCPQSMVIRSPGCGGRCSGATRCHWPPDTGCTRSRSIVVRALTGAHPR
jgi:hypothetical protein